MQTNPMPSDREASRQLMRLAYAYLTDAQRGQTTPGEEKSHLHEPQRAGRPISGDSVFSMTKEPV